MSEEAKLNKLAFVSRRRVWIGTVLVSLFFLASVSFFLKAEFIKQWVAFKSLVYITTPQVFLATGLLIMFTSRTRGVASDIRAMKRAFDPLSFSKDYPWGGDLFLFLYTVSYSLMVLSYSYSLPRFYFLALSFWFINLLFWAKLRPFMKSAITSSVVAFNQGIISPTKSQKDKDANREYVIRGERCEILREFLFGKWITYRHIAAFSMLALMGILLLDSVHAIIAAYAPFQYGALSSILFLLMVCYTEFHVWIQRLTRKGRMKYLKVLATRTDLVWR